MDLEEASGTQNLDVSGDNNGDAADPWPGNTGRTAFNATSSPNSNLYSGGASNVSVSNIRPAGTGCTVDPVIGTDPVVTPGPTETLPPG